jgi:hypothetical protein
MIPSRHSFVTAAWIVLNIFPLLVIALVWLTFENWVWGLLLLILYPLCFVPYGFFVAMPLMVKLFRKPASPYRC